VADLGIRIKRRRRRVALGAGEGEGEAKKIQKKFRGALGICCGLLMLCHMITNYNVTSVKKKKKKPRMKHKIYKK
jgi:hypothetical protein